MTQYVIYFNRCEKEYFVDEIGLDNIPEGDWFCNSCVINKKKSNKGKRSGK